MKIIDRTNRQQYFERRWGILSSKKILLVIGVMSYEV